MYRVAIMGASGLAGGEILRILANHGGFRVSLVTSASSTGRPVRQAHPHLAYAYRDLTFSPEEAVLEGEWDLIFLALPHRKSAPWVRRLMPLLEGGRRLVDLSGDFRLRDTEAHRRWYGEDPAEDLRGAFVYGLPELHREEIRSASLVSGVGCNATAATLAALPLVRSGLSEAVLQWWFECRVGSSEGGSVPNEGGMHVFRSRTMRVVSCFSHRHLGEVSQELRIPEEAMSLTVTSVEMVRGVQCLLSAPLREPLTEGDLWRALRSAYGTEPFVDLCPPRPGHMRLPDPRLVLGSNRALVGFSLSDDRRRLLVGCAIDNLMKGAAGTAVQCANLMFRLPEEQGLIMPPAYPA